MAGDVAGDVAEDVAGDVGRVWRRIVGSPVWLCYPKKNGEIKGKSRILFL